MTQTSRKYDVAISFAGEDRAHAEALAEALKNRGVSVFYDKYEKATLWGKDLYIYLSDLYQNQAKYCVMFLSKNYATKLWTNHERKSAQARAFQGNTEYILPIRLDDTQIPGILPTIGYLSWFNETPDVIADAIFAKISQEKSDVVAANENRLKHPISWTDLQTFYFETFDFADSHADDLDTLKKNLPDIWLPYTDDIWSATISDGVYALSNLSNPKAVRYKFLGINDQEMSELPVSVEIKVDLTKATFLSGAGLIYRFNRESKDYYAFTISNGDRFVFYKRQAGTYKPLYSSRSNIIQIEQFNKIAIVGARDIFGLYINDTFVKTVQDSELEEGDLGIIAMGLGKFFFDNFSIYRSTTA